MLIENVTFVELPATAYWYAGGNNMDSPTMLYWYALRTGTQKRDTATQIEVHCRSTSFGLWRWWQRHVAGNGKCGGGSKGS